MRLLLDTHALVWWAISDERLSAKARNAIEDGSNEINVSAVTAMEICTKVRLGKFEDARALSVGFSVQMLQQGFGLLDLTADHSERAGSLSISNKDPFDRLLIAQAQLEQMTLVSNERQFDDYAVLRLW